MKKIIEATYHLLFFKTYTHFSRWFEISSGILVWLNIALLVCIMSGCVKEGPSGYAEISSVEEQEKYEVSHDSTWSNADSIEYGLLPVWYKVKNTGFGEIHKYSITFAVLLTNGNYIYTESFGTGVRDYSTSLIYIETNGQEAQDVLITNLQVE
jgi:hypothetical protein